MEAFVERMKEEHKALLDKMTKLANFISHPNGGVNVNEYALLYTQYEAMSLYERMLRSRLTIHGVVVMNGEYYEKPKEEVKEEVKEEN